MLFSGAIDVAAGFAHSMVLMEDGRVLTTGRNNVGQLGGGSTADRSRLIVVGSTMDGA